MSHKTEIVPAYDKAGNVDGAAISRAAELLRASELVAFPTETVYGLGANALDPAATRKIFEAKGRPANNPLIVHVHDIDQARELSAGWPGLADKLAGAFWPGALTIVVKKASMVPDIITAGGNMVALRCPDDPVALELIRKCGFPLAAPSANRSNLLSPTTAEHVLKSLNGRLPLILDGGPCRAGIESTVVGVDGDVVRILRPGILGAADLEAVAGIAVADGKREACGPGGQQSLLSPGQLPVHYAPQTRLLLVGSAGLFALVDRISSEGKRIGVMTFGASDLAGLAECEKRMPRDPKSYAHELYATLHELDETGLDVIVCELPPGAAEWGAVKDRLSRAGQLSR